MRLKPGILGQVGIRLLHTLTPTIDGVHVLRRLELAPRSVVRLIMCLAAGAFRAENQRMLRTLKTVDEGRRVVANETLEDQGQAIAALGRIQRALLGP